MNSANQGQVFKQTSSQNNAGTDQQKYRGEITIIGAGIVGLASAIELQREGFSVTLIDKEGAGAGAS
ncbi:FAD-dependent oxidoreductase, partial [Shewanella sairae]